MAINTSLQALEPRKFGYSQAQHLLNRAGFGGTPAQVRALVDMGLNDAVAHLVDYDTIDASALPGPEYDADLLRPPTADERDAMQAARKSKDREAEERFRALRQIRENEDADQMDDLADWWLGRMIQTPRPLEE